MLARKVIYDAPQDKFFQDVLTKRIADQMRENFKSLTGRTISDPEYNAWDHSLGEIKNLVELAGVTGLYFSFEYQVPYCQQRIDCLIFGKNPSGKGVVVHIELKAWQKVDAAYIREWDWEQYHDPKDLSMS